MRLTAQLLRPRQPPRQQRLPVLAWRATFGRPTGITSFEVVARNHGRAVQVCACRATEESACSALLLSGYKLACLSRIPFLSPGGSLFLSRMQPLLSADPRPVLSCLPASA
jgi:hypothetical protein